MDILRKQGFTRFISLTNNPNLKKLYQTMGFEPCNRPEYLDRQVISPGVAMFFKQIH
jgi:amino-acid N-acetyltransferase